MGIGGALLLAIGAVFVFTNVVTMRRLWTSPIFETPQKIAQTALMWLVPGSAIVVWNILREPRIGDRADATVGGAAAAFTDWLFSVDRLAGHQSGDGAQHHSDGQHHHTGMDGGGHHDGSAGGGGHNGGGGFGGDGGAGGHF